MERNPTRRFVSAPATISTRQVGWPHATAAINPPVSRLVLERLSERLNMPVGTGLPSKEQIRSGAYDRMAAHCYTESHKPHPSMLWAYEACADVIKQHSKSFYFSTRLLPRGKRNGIMALYAFCRLSDDIVDEADGVRTTSERSKAGAEAALLQWAKANHRPPGEDGHPVATAWTDTRTRYAIPSELPDELIEGIRMDLTIDSYDTWNDLWVYCYRVASTVGLMSMYITGAETMEAVPYAVQLGVALQLTNILRDVGEDARNGRIYLPREDMERFGYSEEMLLAGVKNKQFVDLMQFEMARARLLYEAAWPGIAYLAADSRVAVAAASTIYRGILGKIAAGGYDVFSHRAHLSALDKMRALPVIWWKSKQLTTKADRQS